MSANYEVRGNVAVITLDNPPVNGLGHDTRKGVTDGLERALDDAAVKAIVITGAGKAFSGGADIREFGSPKAIAEPNLLSVILALEASTKPIVAAVHSVAMGGGLELALGCHYRVAAPSAQISLPEVKIGLIPGAGGTQRLPRVLGLETALNLIVSGATVPATMLAKTGLFDELIEGDLVAGATHPLGGRDRRRHDGRRHCHVLRQRGHPGARAGSEAGGARQGARHHPQELRGEREERKAHLRASRRADIAPAAHPLVCGPRP